mmetsp:Transcript_15197/g.26347  ORF Transcript_15197/g.26347 Transcript_15197/m.26347 type:complete len:309 (-) Transcript_15197:135-1061(-)
MAYSGPEAVTYSNVTTEGHVPQQQPCSARICDVRGITAVLQALKSGSKKQLFDTYSCPGGVRHTFGLQLDSLLSTLSIFSSAPSSIGLRLTYPGPQDELLCEMEESTDGDGGPCVVTYARLNTVEQRPSRDLNDYWAGPTSWFLTKGGLLREAIEDLEWPQGDVEVLLGTLPNRLLLTAQGLSGRLELEMPMSELLGMYVQSPSQPQPNSAAAVPVEVHHSYKYKAMRAAFCSLPHGTKEAAGHVSSKVSIDSVGMLKCLHVVKLQGSAGQYIGPASHAQDSAMGGTPRMGEGTAVVTFVTVPVLGMT